MVATHIRLGPRIPDPEPVYGDMATEVRAFLRSRAEDALAAGIPRCRIMVDDGLDLGKTEAQSLELLRASPAVLEVFGRYALNGLLAAGTPD